MFAPRQFVVDLSSNNDGIDFRALSRIRGLYGVMLKATEGLTWNDPDFKLRKQLAEKNGLRAGGYHFARPDLHPFGAQQEAEHFCRVLGRVGRRDLRPWLDYEIRNSHGIDEPWAGTFNGVCKRIGGVLPAFYSYSALLGALRFRTPVGAGLVVASYSRNDGQEHAFAVPRPWRRAAAHQFSSRCRVAGCRRLVDVSTVYQPRALLAHPVSGWLP